MGAWAKPYLDAGWAFNPGDSLRVDFPNGSGNRNELVKYHRDVPGIDRAAWNIAQFLVHPLHNFLQYHLGLDNEDEIQLMLSPVLVSPQGVRQRHAYVATNSERLTQDQLDGAVHEWKVLNQFHVVSLQLGSGAPCRAEVAGIREGRAGGGLVAVVA
jgi:hypothetical protein